VVKKANRELELEQKYIGVFENLDEGLCLIDKDMVVTFANERFCEILGYRKDEICGKEVSWFLRKQSKNILMRELEKRRKGYVSRYTIKFIRKGGEEITILLSGVPIFDKKGKLGGCCIIISDITERKKLEEDLQRRTKELEKETKKRSQLLVDLYKGVAVAEERGRLARVIHDGLAQSLASSLLKTELCERLIENNPEKLKRELLELRNMLAKSVKSTRQVIFEMELPELHRTGFATVLKQYLEEFRKKTGILPALNLRLEESIPTRVQVGSYRIIREAMNNIRKHARANHINLRLVTTKDGYLDLNIEDDGKGFDVKKVLALRKYAKHFGLRGMEAQAKGLGGSFAVESAKGQGTRVKVKIPLRK